MKNCIDRSSIIDYRKFFIPYIPSRVHLHLFNSVDLANHLPCVYPQQKQENKNKKIKRPQNEIKIKFYELEL
jgi:hypothetical protein